MDARRHQRGGASDRGAAAARRRDAGLRRPRDRQRWPVGHSDRCVWVQALMAQQNVFRPVVGQLHPLMRIIRLVWFKRDMQTSCWPESTVALPPNAALQTSSRSASSIGMAQVKAGPPEHWSHLSCGSQPTTRLMSCCPCNITRSMGGEQGGLSTQASRTILCLMAPGWMGP